MAFIILVTIILFLVLFGWTWSNMIGIEQNKKIAYIFISTIIMFCITFVIFTISKTGVKYENENMVVPIRNLLVSVFTAFNGYIVIQYIAKVLGKLNEEEIELSEAKRRIIKILVIFLVIAVIECWYLKHIQNGILGVYNLNR